jgi:hypothetical protein
VAGKASTGRFGIDNLRAALSDELVKLTRKELPAMRKAVADSLRLVRSS